MTTKAEFISRIGSELSLNKKASTAVLNTVVGIIKSDLTSGARKASIPGVGKLVLGTRQARSGRNPRSGEVIQIPERTAVRFRPSAALKRDVA